MLVVGGQGVGFRVRGGGLRACNIGALTIRIGFVRTLYSNYNKAPPR